MHDRAWCSASRVATPITDADASAYDRGMIGLDDEASADEAERRATWEAAVGSALERLDGRTPEGLVVPALADPTVAQPDRGRPGEFPYVRGNQVGAWDVRSWVRTSDAAEAARHLSEDLAEGATSVWVTVGGDGVPLDRLDVALDPVHLEAAPIVVQAAGGITPLAAADALAELLEHASSRHPCHQLGFDPFAGGRLDEAATVHVLQRAIALGVRGVVIDGSRWADQGAGDAAEIGIAVAAGLAVLRVGTDAGLADSDVLRALEFRLTVTDDQMVSIAKLRAARLLWSGALRRAEIADADAAMRQHAVTARAMLTRYDSWTNLLRTTIAGFAAAVGGAESLTVLPCDVAIGHPTSLTRRMARNVPALLREESHLGATTDPAGGAYAVEELTGTVAKAAWAEVRRVESVGGLDAALADGSVTALVAQAAQERRERVRTRSLPITGVSEFPAADEDLPQRTPWKHPDEVVTWAEEFEALRDRPTSRPVLLATMGTVAQHTARAGFAANLCAAGGVPTVSAGATNGPEDVAVALQDAATTVAVLAGTDEQYAQDGAAHVKALRTAGATWVVLAGKPTRELADLVDDHVAIGVDAVSACERLRDHLEGSES